MITNIRVETSDEERQKIGKTLGLGRMVTRKDLKEAIDRHVKYLVSPGEVDGAGHKKTVPSAADEPDTRSTEPVRRFVPSRGDEPYIAQPKDSGIADACSRILDAAELIQNFAWDTIERNRK